MSEIYFPSCNFTKMAPTAAKTIRSYLAEKMQVAGCCRVDKLAYEEGLTGLYFCQACRETLENRVPGKYQLKNLFEYLVDDKDFPWPDYSGLIATVQDCWRDRNHPEIHEAVRTALAKMKVRVIEMEENREKAVYCGPVRQLVATYAIVAEQLTTRMIAHHVLWIPLRRSKNRDIRSISSSRKNLLCVSVLFTVTSPISIAIAAIAITAVIRINCARQICQTRMDIVKYTSDHTMMASIQRVQSVIQVS